jgi:cytochrome c biogenesis factor
VRLYHKPLVLLIWLGPVLMAFGGMLSLSDRRAAGRRAEAGGEDRGAACRINLLRL